MHLSFINEGTRHTPISGEIHKIIFFKLQSYRILYPSKCKCEIPVPTSNVMTITAITRAPRYHSSCFRENATGITKADHKAVYSKRGRTIGRWRPGGG